MYPENDVKRALSDDEPVFGAWADAGSPRMAETLAGSGLDWVGVDREHTPFTAETTEALVRAVEGSGATTLVRLPSVDAALDGAAKCALDSGAGGIIVPGVETPGEAERVVGAARFPPVGDRGVSGSVRANGHGRRFDEYVSGANEATLVVVQIESRAGVERASETLAVDGVDVVLVGQNDLSASHGFPGRTDLEAVRADVDAIRDAALANDVAAGIVATTPEDIASRIDEGYRFFLVGGALGLVRTGVESVVPASR